MHSYMIVGTGACRDSSSRTTRFYDQIGGHTDGTCRSQCEQDDQCIAYHVNIETEKCVINAPEANSAPDGWEWHPGSGAHEVSTGAGNAEDEIDGTSVEWPLGAFLHMRHAAKVASLLCMAYCSTCTCYAYHAADISGN